MLYSYDYWIYWWLKIGLDSCKRSYFVQCIVCHSRIVGDESIHCPTTSYGASKVVPHDTLQFLQQKGNPQGLFFSLEKISTAIWWAIGSYVAWTFQNPWFTCVVRHDLGLAVGSTSYLNLPWMFWLYLWPRSINGLGIWFDFWVHVIFI